MTNIDAKKILIADDEENVRYTFDAFLTGAGYRVQTSSSLDQCLEKINTETFDLIYLDVNFGIDDGIESIKEIKQIQPQCEIVIMTGSHEPELIIKATRQGARDYLVKPIREPSLLYNTSKFLTEQKGIIDE